ncbi:MAG: 4Fe-4S binding protein [bacterium]
MSKFVNSVPETEKRVDSSETVLADRKVSPAQGFRLDLFEWIPGLKRFARLRSFQFLMMLPNLLVFHLLFIAGIFGTPVGNKNIIIVFIWILWWFMLIAIMVPFASRIWCTMCPMPFFGDWLQRLALITVRPGKTRGIRNKLFGLNLRWPRRFSNIWLQNIAFLTLCTFSAHLVTRPIVTVGVLGGLVLLATVLALFYRMRTFCNYICPVSGFLSLYSMASTIELRSKDTDVCLKCGTKGCRTGSENGWACPWLVYLGKLDRNNYCGLCMECIKSCPNDNIALNLRPFATDTKIKGFDEAWKGFIMLALAMAYSVILLGTNGTIKDWANVAESGMWGGFVLYALILWSVALVLVPGIFYGCSWLARRFANIAHIPVKEVFLGYSFVLVPLGLLAWIAFSVPLLFVNGSYIISVISDPLGWGWNLFGTAHFPWQPLWPEYLGFIQIGLLLLGLFYALYRGYQIGESLFNSSPAAFKGLIPIAAFSVAVTLAFLRFFTG